MITLPKKSTKKLLKLNQHKIRLGLERVNKALKKLLDSTFDRHAQASVMPDLSDQTLSHLPHAVIPPNAV